MHAVAPVLCVRHGVMLVSIPIIATSSAACSALVSRLTSSCRVLSHSPGEQLCQIVSWQLDPRLDSEQKLRMLRTRPPRFFRSREQARAKEETVPQNPHTWYILY